MKNLLWTSVPVLVMLIPAMNCHGQSVPGYRRTTQSTNQVCRTIVTYGGQVVLATPHFDVMGDGRVVFKQQGMRFDSSGYVWSPAIHDETARRGRYEGRVVGTPTKYWPPIQSSDSATAFRKVPVATPRSSYYSGRVQVTAKPAMSPATPMCVSGVIEQANSFNADSRSAKLGSPKSAYNAAVPNRPNNTWPRTRASFNRRQKTNACLTAANPRFR